MGYYIFRRVKMNPLGITSEQSINLFLFCPSMLIFSIDALNAFLIAFWFTTKLCHVHAVLGSRAMAPSLSSLISPASGDMTSPSFPPVPGKSVPRSWVSMKNCESKTPGVESNGVPGMVGSTLSEAAMEWEARRATTSSELNPASLKRSRILVTESIDNNVRAEITKDGG